MDELSDEHKFLVARARAIEEYASVESALADIFISLLGTKHTDRAAYTFYSITSAHTRNTLVGEFLEREFGDKYGAYWTGMRGQEMRKAKGMWRLIKSLDQVRNNIVHWHPVYGLPLDEGAPIREGIARPFHATVKPPPIIDRDELADFIYKAFFVHMSLTQFNRLAILEEGLSDPGSETWLGMFQQPAAYPPDRSHPLTHFFEARQSPPQTSDV